MGPPDSSYIGAWQHDTLGVPNVAQPGPVWSELQGIWGFGEAGYLYSIICFTGPGQWCTVAIVKSSWSPKSRFQWYLDI